MTDEERQQRLQAFSAGEIGYRQLMRELKIESDEELFLTMCAAGLPMPTLSEAELQQMSDDTDKVLKHAGL